MQVSDKVTITNSWFHVLKRKYPETSPDRHGLTADSVLTGEITKIYKNGTVNVRVNEIRNHVKIGCVTTMGKLKVLNFKITDCKIKLASESVIY